MWFFHSWRDLVEIIFFFCLFHRIITWLQWDAHNRLLLHFFSYCIFFGFAFVLQLETVCSFLLAYLPVIAALFVILHERTLQKNFVTKKNVTPVKNSNWTESVMRSCLYAINSETDISFIIENTDSIERFIDAPFFINGILSYELIKAVITSSLYDEKKSIWVTAHATVCAINAGWKQEFSEDITHKTDTIFLSANSNTGYFTIFLGGAKFERLTPNQALSIIKKETVSHAPLNKGTHHAPNHAVHKNFENSP